MSKDDIIRADIVRAAETLFQKWGLKKTTMEDIAAEAGKGKSTIYYYFQSKSDILLAVLDVQIVRILQKARQEVDKQKTAKGKLLAYVSTTFKEIRDTMTLFDVLRGEVKIDREFIRNVRRKYDTLDEQIMRSILEYGFKTKEFKASSARNIEAITRALLGIKLSLIINVFVENDDQELIGLILDLMSRGL